MTSAFSWQNSVCFFSASFVLQSQSFLLLDFLLLHFRLHFVFPVLIFQETADCMILVAERSVRCFPFASASVNV